MHFSSFLLLLILPFIEGRVRNDCNCGESNLKGVGRIVNGRSVKPHTYPWMAAMFTGDAFMCGGAIISDRNVMTAGHCVFYVPDPYQTYWVLGMHDQRLQDGDKYNVEHFALHPRFVNHTVYDDYDMAIIRLSSKIRFGPNVRPICLPTPNDEFTGKYAIVAGWGRLSEDKDARMGMVLQETKVRVKPNRECQGEVKRLVHFNAASMICGYEPKTDACQGDSGGPFFIETQPNRYEIFGVVSFGDGCARNFPGIYGKLSEPQTLNWIEGFIAASAGDVCADPKKGGTSLKNLLNRLVSFF